jgi:tripartite-type tricarboxylate transporter receptor subunit TctC
MRLTFLSAALCALALAPAQAQDLDCDQIRLIVPYGGGGATDVASRVVADRLQPVIGKTVIVENKPGATGNIGTRYVIGEKPDGCTLLVNATVIATFLTSFKNLGYDPYDDLVPIGGLARTPNVIVSAPEVPANNLTELVALAKKTDGGISYGTSGFGLQQHLVAEAIAQQSDSEFVLVPYKAASEIITDVLSSRLQFASLLIGTTKGMVQQGKLKALAVAQDERSRLLPDVPTTTEQGFPGLNGAVHFLIFAPAGTPAPVVARLEGALKQVIGDPAVTEHFLTIGFETTPMTSKEVTAEMHRTADTFAPVIKSLGISLN